MQALTDRQAEMFISRVLRTGVILSAVMTFVGFVFYLLHHSGELAHYMAFAPSRGSFYSLPLLIRFALAARARAIMEVGILVLIATPVARVASLIGAFAFQRDRLYIGVSSLVLLVLLFSLVFMR